MNADKNENAKQQETACQSSSSLVTDENSNNSFIMIEKFIEILF